MKKYALSFKLLFPVPNPLPQPGMPIPFPGFSQCDIENVKINGNKADNDTHYQWVPGQGQLILLPAAQQLLVPAAGTTPPAITIDMEIVPIAELN